ncbi:hypothetical protein CkaCkLH20_11692 [Colletotrichum karsti]|uniref:C3H1-type domain-containing protein n=1 Tax=Colletotrichum karsti TaxID=1095194 RepID=A0A9P6LEU4_9PEZI|nr:uncharacterized protein CkaCkLH20_11692 [Colletotrichum karsti]KAF9870793.1 hypothetical protein CkaCkLH20_11692 [Colletotrichum karsti]
MNWLRGACPNGQFCSQIHGSGPPPSVDLKRLRCPTLDREGRCTLEDRCPYSHEEWKAEYFDRPCPAELNGPVADQAQEEQQAEAQVSSPPETVWRTNPVIFDGTCGRRPKPRNDNGPDKAKTEEHAGGAPSQPAPAEPAPVEPAPVEPAPVEAAPAESAATNSTSRRSGTAFRTPRPRQPGMADSESEHGDRPTYKKSRADEVEVERRQRTRSRRNTR